MRQTAVKEEEVFTYQDYIHFPDNGKRYQIIHGEVYMTPAPVPYHQRIIIKLSEILDEFVVKNNLGVVFIAPCDILLSDEDIVQPDIFFISNENLDIIKEKYIEGVPDLAVEIISPYTQKLDKIFKKKLYETYRVKEYWIVEPDKKTMEIFSHTGRIYDFRGIYEAGDMVASDLIKGLKFNLSEIF